MIPPFLRFRRMAVAALTASILLAAPPARVQEVHVSPYGDDTHPGTRARLLATLEAARDRLWAEASVYPGAKGAGSRARRSIIVRAGDHVRDRTLELDGRDSGLTVRGEPGARILGARRLDGWTPSTDPRLPETARGRVQEVSLAGIPGATGPLARR